MSDSGQKVKHLSRPERLRAAEQWSVEKRAARIAAGIPEEAMEDDKVLPAMQRLGGHGPPIEVGYNRRCGHCAVLKPRVMYAEFMTCGISRRTDLCVTVFIVRQTWSRVLYLPSRDLHQTTEAFLKAASSVVHVGCMEIKGAKSASQQLK